MPDQSLLTVAFDTQIQPNASSSLTLGSTSAVGPFHADAIALHPQATSAQAFTVIATSCLKQIVLNEAGVVAGSGEALHQMRVGLRRLRAAFSIFKSLLRPREFDGLKEELVWLTEQLGAAREYDVLCEAARTHDAAAHAALGPDGELGEELNRRRQDAFAVAGRAMQSARFRRLIVSAAVTLISRMDAEGKGQRPIRKLASEILEHRTRCALRRLAEFSRLDVGDRHKLRIYLKKLRYGAEFFAASFPRTKRAHKCFIRALEALQDALGSLNDGVVHRRIARELVTDDNGAGRAGRRIAFAMGAFTASEDAELTRLLTSFPKLCKRFEQAPRFWR